MNKPIAHGIKVVLLTGILLLLTACGKTSKPTTPQQVTPKQSFKLPEIPVMLTTPEDRARYLATHYWDHYDFADTTLKSKPEITEQAFVDFIQVLGETPLKNAEAGIDTLLNRAMTGDSVMYAHFVGLAEKYLYDPNSPMRNEDYYMEVLRNIISSPQVDEIEKLRPKYRLDMARKNRVGTPAADFEYMLTNGRKNRLSAIQSNYVLLFFNNPDCQDCKRVKEHILQSPVFKENAKVTILSIYPDDDVELWEQTPYPSQWINGCSKGLRDGKTYDLRAIPNLYLLDKDKRVLIKDGTIENIQQYLVAHM